MSNIDKHAELRKELSNPAIGSNAHLRKLALALLDELEAKDKRIIDLEATTSHSNAGWKEAHEQEARAEAAEKRIAELERKEQHSERQSVIDALAGSGEAWSDIEEYMQEWDAARAAAAGKGEAS